MYTLRLYDKIGSTIEATITDVVVVSWSGRINGPGRMVYKLPVGSVNASASRLRKYRRVRLWRRDQDGSDTDRGVFYGYIESHKRTSDAEYTVSCVGVLQLFALRYTAKDEDFSTGGGSTEAFGLLSDTNSGDGDTGIVAGDGGVTTTKALKVSGRKDILGTWGDMAKAHTAEFEIDFDGRFNFVPSLGADKTATVTLRYRTDGNPGNTVDGLSDGEDGAPLRNKIIGTNAAGTLTSTKQDATSQGTYPVLVEVKVFNEAQDQNTLDDMTQAFLDQVKNPIPDFGANPSLAERRFDVVSGDMQVEGFQYGDVVPGDLVTCDIVSDSQTIQASKRVVEILVNVDENGKESVQYTLGDSGVFVTVNSLTSSEPQDTQRRLLQLEQRSGTGGGGGGGGSSPTFVDNDAYTGSINGSNTAFVLTATPITGSVYVWKNGQLMTPSVDFTLSGTTVTFTTAPLTGDSVVISYRTSSGTTNFSDPAAPTGTVDGINAVFTVSHTPTTGSLYVWIDGRLQAGGGSDYTLSGTTITFTTPPVAGATILVAYRY